MAASSGVTTVRAEAAFRSSESWILRPHWYLAARDFAALGEELLGEPLKAKGDLFDSDVIRRKWAEHISGDRDWGNQLWNVLMFQAWHRRWL